MSASQYRDYMKGLDAAAARWQKQIKSVDIGKMKIDYSSGKAVERARGAVLKSLSLMRTLIEQQHSMEALSRDILIQDTIGDASEPLTVLEYMLPANEEGLYWQRTLPAISTEMTDLQDQLRIHIDAYADKLQLEAAGCSK
jgi:hypothetical protein